mgnify:FL=1
MEEIAQLAERRFIAEVVDSISTLFFIFIFGGLTQWRTL